MVTKIYENEPTKQRGVKGGDGKSHNLILNEPQSRGAPSKAAAKSGSPTAAGDQVVPSMDVRVPMIGKENNRDMQDSLLESVEGPNMHSKMLIETHRAVGIEQLDSNTELKASRMEMFNKIHSSSVSAPKDGDMCSFKGGTTTVFSKYGPEDPVMTAPYAEKSPAMNQLKVERYLKRAQMILESAWLINQELNLQKPDVEGDFQTSTHQAKEIDLPDLHYLTGLMKEKEFEKVQTKI